MNNNLIITHKDGRTWNEGQLGLLVAEINPKQYTDNVSLEYKTGVGWQLCCESSYESSYIDCGYENLDPSRL